MKKRTLGIIAAMALVFGVATAGAQVPDEGGVDWVAADYTASKLEFGAPMGIGVVPSDSTKNGIQWKAGSSATLKSPAGTVMKCKGALSMPWDSKVDGDCLIIKAPAGIKSVVLYVANASSSKPVTVTVKSGSFKEVQNLNSPGSKKTLVYTLPSATSANQEIRIAVDGKSDAATGTLNLYRVSLR